jgi:hypothetical protein
MGVYHGRTIARLQCCPVYVPRECQPVGDVAVPKPIGLLLDLYLLVQPVE